MDFAIPEIHKTASLLNNMIIKISYKTGYIIHENNYNLILFHSFTTHQSVIKLYISYSNGKSFRLIILDFKVYTFKDFIETS